MKPFHKAKLIFGYDCSMSNRIKRTFLLCLIATALYMVLGPQSASAEIIHKFHADITINPDASIDVVEIINVDFQGDEKHGIYRQIPVQYQRYGSNYRLPFDLTDVQLDGAETSEYVMNRQGADEMIKIGSPDKTITGEHTYKIAYHVRRALNFLANDQSPELYWNVTGNEWPWEIEEAVAHVYAPPSVSLNDIRTESFCGPPGGHDHAIDSQAAGFKAFQAQHIAPGNELTIVEGLPPDSIAKPPAGQAFFDALIDWWPAVFFPVGTFFVMYVLWWHTGRDEDGDRPIAVEWNPPTSLSPAEVGTLIDESCDLPDIVSTLVDLAVRGHLKIRQLKEDGFLMLSNYDYEFTKTTPAKNDILLAHESRFLNGIFAYGNVVKLSYLKEKFYATIPGIKADVYESLTNRKLFTGNPDAIRKQYVLMGVAVLLVGAFAREFGVPWGVGGVSSGLIILLFTKYMPARTGEGSRLTRECLGFARYVRLAEKDRLRVLANEDPTLFGRLLPYAMVLNCADQWAHAFEGLLREPPDWYAPYGYNNTFSSFLFVTDLGQGMRTMQSTFVSVPPSSSGTSAASGGSGFSGGFSGGGFGGGGGGSW